MIVANYLLSGIFRSTLDYVLIDRSNRDLLNDDRISREKSGPVSQSFEIMIITSCIIRCLNDSSQLFIVWNT